MSEGPDFSRILDKVARLAGEAGAPLDEAELLPYLPKLRRCLDQPRKLYLLLNNRPVAWRVRLVQGLIGRCSREAPKSPEQAMEAARLACEAAEALPDVAGFNALHWDLRAEALAYVANAYRLRSDFRAAKATWRRVRRVLAGGSADPLLHAEVGEIESALLTDLAHYRNAAAVLRRSLRTYRSINDAGRTGRTAYQLSRVHHFSNQPAQALEQLCAAMAAFESAGDSHLKFLALNCMLAYLEDLGEPLLAAVLLENYWATARTLAPPPLFRDLRWLRGRLHNALNSPEGARHWLEPVRQELIAEGRTLDAALCSLDLALAYAQSRAWLPQKRLAEEMLPIFQSLEVEREALAALLLYVNAAQEYDASAQLVQQVIESTQPLRKGGASHQTPTEAR